MAAWLYKTTQVMMVVELLRARRLGSAVHMSSFSLEGFRHDVRDYTSISTRSKSTSCRCLLTWPYYGLFEHHGNHPQDLAREPTRAQVDTVGH